MTIYIYGDESGADGNNRYLIHGILIVRHTALIPLRAALRTVLDDARVPDELKWTAISNRTRERDRAAASLFFQTYQNEGCLSSPRFQALIVDQHRLNIGKFHAGDKDMCFYKLLFQLLSKRIREMAAPGEDVRILLDRRTTRNYDLADLREVINDDLWGRLGARRPMVRTVEYRDSRNECLLQLADLLCGAVCFHQNRRHERWDCSHAKREIAEYIAGQAGLVNLAIAQNRLPKFGLWTLRLRN